MNSSSSSMGGDGRHDDDAALTEFLASLMDYTPTIPDELVEHYLARSGFHCPDIRMLGHVLLDPYNLGFAPALNGLFG
ncbi:hypothetical protein ZIOFF_026819 [Zingiber officinale]|uniref:Transcription initiation factor TFIID subunit 10 n=1 Tax=Zingiber officinale TaxID=94328 RepID=A0A8J5L7K4_ZINOF|nr:hypothetical protein ZIOFF_026819 [Zingiber officinale]